MSYIPIMARTIILLSLVSVLTQDSLYSSAASEAVEPGQYVHNPDWDLTPYQIWKRKQAAKAGTTQISGNTIAAAPVEKKVVTVRRQKPVQKQQQQPRFDNFQAVQQQPASTSAAVLPAQTPAPAAACIPGAAVCLSQGSAPDLHRSVHIRSQQQCSEDLLIHSSHISSPG